MFELTMEEIDSVSGGVAKAGTLARPTAGESEPGRIANDIAGALNAFGGWLGCKIYWTH